MTTLTTKISFLTGFKSGTAKGMAAGHRPFIHSFLLKFTMLFNSISDPGKTTWNSTLKINKYCLKRNLMR